MNLTDQLDVTRPEWFPAPPIPQEDDMKSRYNSMHIDAEGMRVTVQYVGPNPVLQVEQTTPAGISEQLRIFFSATDVNAQLDLAEALEEVAESLRDRASASFAAYMAEQRREERLHALAEQANDQSGFDSPADFYDLLPA